MAVSSLHRLADSGSSLPACTLVAWVILRLAAKAREVVSRTLDIMGVFLLAGALIAFIEGLLQARSAPIHLKTDFVVSALFVIAFSYHINICCERHSPGAVRLFTRQPESLPRRAPVSFATIKEGSDVASRHFGLFDHRPMTGIVVDQIANP